jgi:protein-tyrosine phosphatase
VPDVSRVLFVCTGNIFRSLTAEYALRDALRSSGRSVLVESAGTEDFPHVVKPVVSSYLRSKGLDVSSHRRRTLTAQMLEPDVVVVAMSTNHVDVLREQFSCHAPLFTAACGLDAQPLPDVDEVIVDHRTNPAAVETHVRMTIDRIIELTPLLAQRLRSGAYPTLPR